MQLNQIFLMPHEFENKYLGFTLARLPLTDILQLLIYRNILTRLKVPKKRIPPSKIIQIKNLDIKIRGNRENFKDIFGKT